MLSFFRHPAAIISQAAQVKQQTITRALSNLNDALPPNLLLGLVQSVNCHTPTIPADELIMRSTCRLRQLQASIPKLRLNSNSNKLEKATRKLQGLKVQGDSIEKQASQEELVLLQALFELYIGLLLHFFVSGGRRPVPKMALVEHRLIPPSPMVFGGSPYADGVCLKRPLPV